MVEKSQGCCCRSHKEKKTAVERGIGGPFIIDVGNCGKSSPRGIAQTQTTLRGWGREGKTERTTQTIGPHRSCCERE